MHMNMQDSMVKQRFEVSLTFKRNKLLFFIV